jgi:hypothetical protein
MKFLLAKEKCLSETFGSSGPDTIPPAADKTIEISLANIKW